MLALVVGLALVCVSSANKFGPKGGLRAGDAPPVTVDLYFESCCPGCEQFIEGTFTDAWNTNGFTDITTIAFYPYGNANERYNNQDGLYNFTCQHGENECRGNLVESCFIGLSNFKQDAWVDFVVAFESQMKRHNCNENAYTIAEQITGQYGIDWTTLHNCIDSKQGNDFEHANAVSTNNLSPSHGYVPWLVVNGVHTENEQDECTDDLLECVCRRYTGTSPACSNYNFPDTSADRCYADTD